MSKFFCEKCGACCGPVPMHKDIIFNNQDKLSLAHTLHKISDDIYIADQQTMSGVRCAFLNSFNRCTIYDIRPELCKQYGFIKGLQCPNNKDVVLKYPSQDEHINIIEGRSHA